MLSFKNYYFFLALFFLLVLFTLFIYTLVRKEKIKQKLGDYFLINNLIQEYSPSLYKLRFFLVLLSLALIIISAANPIKESKSNINHKNGIDIMFAIDASNSMLSTDVAPSRLEVSKLFINNLLKELSNDRIGIIGFGGKPFLQLPVTTDIEAAKMYIRSISTDAVPEQGTAIGKALKLCNSSLNLPEKRSKAIILISDGEDHDPTSRDEANQLNKLGITLFTVGTGTAQGSKIIDKETGEYKKDENDQVIVSSLNESLLKEIAIITKGKYFHINDLEPGIRALLNEINKLEQSSITEKDGSEYISYYWLFLSAAILLLISEIFVPEIKRRSNSII